MKLNKLMAAALVALTGLANAALDRPGDVTPGVSGSLMLLAYDNTGSPVSIGVDLGINVNSFRTFDLVDGNYLTQGGLASGHHQITWDFANNTVTTSTPGSVVTGFDPFTGDPTTTTTGDLVASIAGNDWSAAHAAFKGLAQAGDVRFAVIGADSANGYYLSTGSNESAMLALSNADVSNFALTDLGLYQSSNLEGTHVTASNGANVVTGTAAPSIIESSIWGVADGWLGLSTFGATAEAGVTQNNFFLLNANTLSRSVVTGETGADPVANAAALLGNRATWTYDFVNSTLRYETVLLAAAVPEPSTYALMALGLVGVGLFARRRQA